MKIKKRFVHSHLRLEHAHGTYTEDFGHAFRFTVGWRKNIRRCGERNTERKNRIGWRSKKKLILWGDKWGEEMDKEAKGKRPVDRYSSVRKRPWNNLPQRSNCFDFQDPGSETLRRWLKSSMFRSELRGTSMKIQHSHVYFRLYSMNFDVLVILKILSIQVYEQIN